VATAVGPSLGTLPGFARWWGREHTRTPDAAWVRALRADSPVSDVHTWLHLAWEPGDWWDPVERWVIYQVRPTALIPAPVLRELRGPDPRSTGHFCGPDTLCGHKRRQYTWVGGCAGLIDRTEWRLYRETGGWARAWWVIQGDARGHLRFFTEAQSSLAELADLPPRPPVMGSLPYAEPDQRTWATLRQFDRLTTGRGGRLLERTAADFAREDRDDALRVRRGLLDMLALQSNQAVDAGGRWWQKGLAEHRLARWRQMDEPEPDYEQDEADFLDDVA
jgi:hypothetical protein